MRLVTTDLEGIVSAGLLHEDRIYSLVEVAGTLGAAQPSRFRTVRSAIPAISDLQELWEQSEKDVVLAGLVSIAKSKANLLAPVNDALKIICVGLNYAAHVREVKRETNDVPTLFPKFHNSLSGPFHPIVQPLADTETDYEGELAVVIGRRVSRESVESIDDAIVGAMAMNDVSARALQRESTQWTRGKAIDSYAPSGPALVTIDEIGDLQNLQLQTRVNGEVLQNANTSQMIWSVKELISFISQTMTLEPGDIIATGTPEGIGSRRQPPRYLAPGDMVEVEIENIGTISNEVISE